MMQIDYVLIINRFGTLIYSQCISNSAKVEQRTYSSKSAVILSSENEGGYAKVTSTESGEEMMLVAPNGRPVHVQTVVNEGMTVQQYMERDSSYPLTVYAKKPPLSDNHMIIFASLFHSLSEISLQILDEHTQLGIKHVKFNSVRVFCYPSIAGLKFVLVCNWRPSSVSERPLLIKIESLLQKLYRSYTRTVPLDPFQMSDQPINSKEFTDRVTKLVADCSDLKITN
ncbi:hypothetical protein ACOME3_005728 [Neoechinorhynchus agilis]